MALDIPTRCCLAGRAPAVGHARRHKRTRWCLAARAPLVGSPRLIPVATFDDVRSIALRLPEVEEKLTWETDATFRVRNKIFVIGADGSDGISLKATLPVQTDLIDLDPETFTPAPYVGRYGWVNVKLARIDRELVEKLLHNAWRSTAPKKIRDLVPEG